MSQTIGFIGLGLIGGSIAKTIRRVHPDYSIIACDANRENLTQALADGTLNQAHDTVSQGFARCDFIFLCAPVHINIHYLHILKNIISPGCILTDVGSVKNQIHKAVESLELTRQFIGGHPMTGSEKSGYASASDRLLENAYYIITPTANNDRSDIDRLVALVKSLGSAASRFRRRSSRLYYSRHQSSAPYYRLYPCQFSQRIR